MVTRQCFVTFLLLAAGWFRSSVAGGIATDAHTPPDVELADPGVFVIYGDTRFTDPREEVAANPGARRALVDQIAAEHPAAVILTGDTPWRGGSADDYAEYRDETRPWQAMGFRVLPVLGNHEFANCAEASCLELWWQAFPQERGHRWYRVDFGKRIRFFALDSNAPLTAGSAQRTWLEQELRSLPSELGFVILGLHHPPVADDGWLIVRQNETSLRKFLESRAPQLPRLIVCAGHVHNYERFERRGVVYLVSGGGGAKPLRVRRARTDRYVGPGFPNYHYLRFELHDDTLTVSMVRLEDYEAMQPHTWQVRDRFNISVRASKPDDHATR
jgi:hypothetical protein